MHQLIEMLMNVDIVMIAALKKSYVDVFNPSGAPMKPIEPIMAPTIPMATPQAGFFVPAPVANNNEQKSVSPI